MLAAALINRELWLCVDGTPAAQRVQLISTSHEELQVIPSEAVGTAETAVDTSALHMHGAAVRSMATLLAASRASNLCTDCFHVRG